MRTAVLVLLGICASSAGAQELPPYVPVNPALASRSALYAQPFIPTGDRWTTRIVADYSNAVEVGTASDGRQYAFDAETAQIDFWVKRDLSGDAFVFGNVALRSAHAGALDGFLNWYHDVIGLRVPARNQRAENVFEWQVELGDVDLARGPAAFVGDLRVGAGMRLGARWQVVASATLPTATTTTEGWARGTIGTSLALTGRVVSSARLALDAGLSTGWTPSHGELWAFQRTVFVGGMVGGWWRFAGEQALFATLWAQSPNWQDTGFSALDRAEVTLDFGALFHLGGGLPQLQVGMTEDLLPSGPAIDAGFKLGLRW